MQMTCRRTLSCCLTPWYEASKPLACPYAGPEPATSRADCDVIASVPLGLDGPADAGEETSRAKIATVAAATQILFIPIPPIRRPGQALMGMGSPRRT